MMPVETGAIVKGKDPWWKRGSRQVWRVLLYIWGVLIVGIIVSTIANLNTTATETPLTHLYLIYVILTYPLLMSAGLSVLLVLTVLSWIGSRTHPATDPFHLPHYPQKKETAVMSSTPLSGDLYPSCFLSILDHEGGTYCCTRSLR